MLKFIPIVALIISPVVDFAQLSTNGGTLTISGAEGHGNYVQRDEVILTNGSVISSTGTQDAHVYLDETIVLPTTYATGGVNTVNQIGTQNVVNIDNSLPVGATDGTSSVLNGIVIYTIPLAVPPGTGGMSPDISIQYSSSQINGIAGHGWNIQAISSIIRVDKDLYHDNQVQAVQLNSSDALSLDGNRLINGSIANSYVLENENFSIISYNSSNDYYIVKTKEGRTMEYGSNTNSKIQFSVSGHPVTYAWYLTKVYDNYGNTIIYNYSQNPTSGYNELALSEIDYTINSNASISGYNSVKFDYEQRADINSKYIQGNLIGSTQLLRQIEIDCESKLMKKYQFTYGENSLQESYLNSITEYGSDGTNLNSTVIQYAPIQTPALGIDGNWVLNNDGFLVPKNDYTFHSPTDSNLDYYQQYISGDFNGDGRTDLLGLGYNINSDNSQTYITAYTYINNDNGLTYSRHGAGLNLNSTNNCGWANQGQFTTLFSILAKGLPTSGTFNIIDVNGDGMDDIVMENLNDGATVGAGYTYDTYISTGTSFNLVHQESVPSLCYFAAGDITGDGLPEGIIHDLNDSFYWIYNLQTGTKSSTSTYINTQNGARTSGWGLCTVDFDGDGLSEFMTSDGTYYFILDPQINSSGAIQSVTQVYKIPLINNTTISSGDVDVLMPCDYNGDGITDYIISPVNGTPIVKFGTGTGVTNGVSIPNGLTHSTQVTGVFGPGGAYVPQTITQTQYLIADINGDQKSDLVLFHSESNPATGQNGGIGVGVSYGGGNINNVNNVTSLQYLLEGYGVLGTIPTFEFPNDKSFIPEFNIGDFDGDGTQEIMYKTQFSPTTNSNENPNANLPNDLSNISRSIINPLATSYPNSPTHLISSITNGLGKQENFLYNSISSINYKNVINIPLSVAPYNNNSIIAPFVYGSYIPSPYYSMSTLITPTYPIVQVQKPLNVITSYSVTDGTGGTPVTTYTYNAAEVEVQGRGFLGFGSITSTNETNAIQVVNSYSVISKALSQLTIIEGVPLSSSTYTLNGGVSTLISSTTYTNSIIQPDNTSNTLQHFIGTIQKNSIDATINAATLTSYTYETVSNYTDDNIATYTVNVNNGLETYTVNNVYQTINDFPGGIPCRVCTTGTKTIRANSTTYSGNIFSYNDQGQVITKKQNPAYFLPTAPTKDKEVDINYTYDSNTGVLLSYQISAPNDDASPPVKSYSFLYDTYKRFPITRQNPLNQPIQTSFEPFWGHPLIITGYDGLNTTYTYDSYGRVLSCTTPDNLISTFQYEWVAAGEGLSDPITSHITIPPMPFKITSMKLGTPTTVKYYDIMGRNVRTKTDGFQNPIYNFTSFDSQGRILISTSPYEVGTSTTYKPIYSIFSYDGLGQISTIIRTDNSTSYSSMYSYSYDISNNLKKVKITPPDGNFYTEIYDASGLRTSAIDNNGTILTYTYDANHNPIQVNLGALTSVATITYDMYGREVSMTEPNSGLSLYEYNAYGLLYTQQDNIGNQYTYYYDALDRITQKTNGSTENYAYTYNTSGNGINLLQMRTGPQTSIYTSYSYDALNRITQIFESTNTGLATQYSYDNYNNISKIVYPGGFSINRSYTSDGYLNNIKRADNGQLIWQATSVNPRGQYTEYKYGNNLINTTKTYDNYGYPISLISKKGNSTIQDLLLSFDQKTGNLTKRVDNYNSGNILTESFVYDNLNRLWKITNTAGSTTLMQYADNGNIKNKPDVGSYTYNYPQQNQVLTVSNPYGAISSNTQSITNGPFKKPVSISEIDAITSLPEQLSLYYGPEQQRRESDFTDYNGALSKTFYSLNYDKQVVGNNTTEINYIPSGDGLCAMFVKSPSDNGKMYYIFKDHLESILTITDDQGIVYYRQSFDAWGQPRDPDTWVQYNAANLNTNNIPPSWLIRGFCGHEELPEFELINMNGRLYEPLTGRMKSVDDHLNDYSYTQAYNRYSYCNNNPLSRIDPSGEDFDIIALIFIVYGGVTDVAENWNNIMSAHYSILAGAEYFVAGGVGALVGFATDNPYIGAAVGAGLTIGFDAVGDIGPGPGYSNILNSSSTPQDWVQAGVSGATSALAGEGDATEFLEKSGGEDAIPEGFKNFNNLINGDDAIKGFDYKSFIYKSLLGISQDYGKNDFDFNKNFSFAQIAKSITANALKSYLDNDKIFPEVDNKDVDVSINTIGGLSVQNYLRTYIINGIANYGGNISKGLFTPKTYNSVQDFSNAFLTPIPSAIGFNEGSDYTFSTSDAVDASKEGVFFLFYLFK